MPLSKYRNHGQPSPRNPNDNIVSGLVVIGFVLLFAILVFYFMGQYIISVI